MKFILNLLFIVLLFTCCNNVTQVKQDNELTEFIIETFKDQDNIIDLSNNKSFEWDELLILRPESDIHKVEKKYNLNLLDLNRINSKKDINLMIFLKNKKAIRFCKIPISSGKLLMNDKLLKKADVSIGLSTDNEFHFF
ncbi:hypothetical protein [uncultured Aquimarina sp.]|uniref:hypothetical protein n=1 Tax=uncultured Aquimarina sp. TaxID=575652 RepID=UPI00260B6C54|nr:hypothetical protein [uncultured Aquimarina sp.]